MDRDIRGASHLRAGIARRARRSQFRQIHGCHASGPIAESHRPVDGCWRKAGPGCCFEESQVCGIFRTNCRFNGKIWTKPFLLVILFYICRLFVAKVAFERLWSRTRGKADWKDASSVRLAGVCKGRWSIASLRPSVRQNRPYFPFSSSYCSFLSLLLIIIFLSPLILP